MLPSLETKREKHEESDRKHFCATNRNIKLEMLLTGWELEKSVWDIFLLDLVNILRTLGKTGRVGT
jgi:hypothetical protein